MAAHKFKVGQLVTLHSQRHRVGAEQFEAVPTNGSCSRASFRYRAPRDGWPASHAASRASLIFSIVV
jgi:hypothetical protein